MDKRRAKGSGYLRHNPDGSLTLIKSLTDPITGKVKKIQVSGPTEAACNKRMSKKLAEAESSIFTKNSDLTVTDLCNLHLNMKYSQKLITRSTMDRDDSTIRNQIDNSSLGHMQIHSITSGDIDTFFGTLISDGKLSAYCDSKRSLLRS